MALRLTHSFAFALAAASAVSAFAGCSSERYYCDARGCYYCDGLGCRDVEPPRRPTCHGDFECAPGTVCTAIGCVDTCAATDSECPDGTVCREGMCIGPTEPEPEPKPGCHFDHECGEDRICVNASCRVACDTNADCPEGGRCMSGYCNFEPGPACTANTDCTGGDVCVGGSCRDSCSRDGDCGAGKYCTPAGYCRVDDRPRPFCTSDAMCMPGHPCQGGVCRTPCDTSAECARFDVQFNYCLDGFCVRTNEATSNCVANEDCNGDEMCIDGVCRR